MHWAVGVLIALMVFPGVLRKLPEPGGIVLGIAALLLIFVVLKHAGATP